MSPFFSGGYMKHVFKLGGERVSPCGESYTVKCVNDVSKYIGWYESLEAAIADKPKPAKKPAKKKAAS